MCRAGGPPSDPHRASSPSSMPNVSNGAQGGGGALIAVGRNLKDAGPRLTEAQYAQAQHPGPHFGVEYTADRVAIVGPDVENAFALTGNGIAGSREVEQQLAVFERDGVRGVGEEGLERSPQELSGNGDVLP